MSLLTEIQAAATDSSFNVSDLLLKVQLLAAKLNSDSLADWIKYESEGYPADSNIPDYRVLKVTYTASFIGAFGSGVNNAPIPQLAITEFAGDEWNTHKIASSLKEIESLVADSNGTLQTGNASNLIYVLQGNIYQDFDCTNVTGRLSAARMAAIAHAVRSRILSLTIELEREFPESVNIALSNPLMPHNSELSKGLEKVTQKIVYGNNTEITNNGDNNSIQLNISSGDIGDLTNVLTDAGIPEKEAKQLSEIMASEEPESKKEPLGKRAQKWLGKNISKAIDGTWKIGASALTGVLTAAAKQYYGLE